MTRGAPVVVHPPGPDGGRHVTIRGEQVGTAHHLLDVLELLRRHGLPEAHEGIDDPRLVEWRGGDSRMWREGP